MPARKFSTTIDEICIPLKNIMEVYDLVKPRIGTPVKYREDDEFYSVITEVNVLDKGQRFEIFIEGDDQPYGLDDLVVPVKMTISKSNIQILNLI